MGDDDVATKLAVHEAVCAERWKQANDRLGRIEVALAAIVLLLLAGEGSVVPCRGGWWGEPSPPWSAARSSWRIKWGRPSTRSYRSAMASRRC